MLTAGKWAGTSTIVPRVPTFLSADESGQCRASGECEVYKSSLLSIRLCTTTLIIKEISRAGPGSNRYVTRLFSNGAS